MQFLTVYVYNFDMLDVLLDAFLDSLKLLPFLFLVYLIIEVVEEKSVGGFKSSRLLNGAGAPLLGASAGLIPQCGFSVMATKLYASRHITMGTLLAVYIATSDEALPIMLSDVSNLPNIFLTKLLPLFGTKFVLALLVGYIVYFFAKRSTSVWRQSGADIKLKAQTKTEKHCDHDTHIHTQTVQEETAADTTEHTQNENIGCCGHKIDNNGKRNWERYFFHPLVHSLKIFAYIFIINLVLGTIIFFVGEETIANALSSVGFFQPLLATVVGLIPNCAASVLLTELFVDGAISLGSAVAGLSINAGLAFAVLFQQNKNLKENLSIIGIAFVSSAAAGTLLMCLGL